MNPLLTTSYWFLSTPLPFIPAVDRAILIVSGLLVVACIVTWMLRLRGGYDKLIKRALSRLATHLGWTGIVGLLLWAIAYERVPWLSMRVAFLVWGIWFVVGLVMIVRFVWRDIPALTARQREQMEQRKWLPKRKK